MVLWNNKGRIARRVKRNRGRRNRKVRRSERGKGRRGFKPDAAAGSTRKPERNHIRLRGVGFRQYRKSVRLPQGGSDSEALAASVKTASPPPESRSRSSKQRVPH